MAGVICVSSVQVGRETIVIITRMHCYGTTVVCIFLSSCVPGGMVDFETGRQFLSFILPTLSTAQTAGGELSRNPNAKASRHRGIKASTGSKRQETR